MRLDARQRIFPWTACPAPRQWAVFELAATDALTVAGWKWEKRRKTTKSWQRQRHPWPVPSVWPGSPCVTTNHHHVCMKRGWLGVTGLVWAHLQLFISLFCNKTAIVYWKCCILMSISLSFAGSPYTVLLIRRTPRFLPVISGLKKLAFTNILLI